MRTESELVKAIKNNVGTQTVETGKYRGSRRNSLQYFLVTLSKTNTLLVLNFGLLVKEYVAGFNFRDFTTQMWPEKEH